MTVNEATSAIWNMSPHNHDKTLFIKCTNVLKNKPELLIDKVPIIVLYINEINFSVTNNILTHCFELEDHKILQLQLLSSISYDDASPAHYLPSILSHKRSIAFKIKDDDYNSFSLLLDHLPGDYAFCYFKNKKMGVIAIYQRK